MTVNYENLVSGMRSDDFVVQLSAVAEAAEITQALVKEAVSALVKSPSPGALASHISTFGSIVHALEQAMIDAVDEEAKVHIGILLLHFGSRSGVNFLLATARSGRGPIVFILAKLAQAGVTESKELIEAAAQGWDFRADPYTGHTLIRALKAAGGKLPPDLKAKIETEAYGSFRERLGEVMDELWPRE